MKKTDYSIRTLSYYQMQGGIYNEIISVLQRVRSSSAGNRIMAPNKVINIACELYDACVRVDEDKVSYWSIEDVIPEYFGGHQGAGPYSGLSMLDQEAIFSVLAILMTQDPVCVQDNLPFVQKCLEDSKLFKFFKDLLQARLAANSTDESFIIKKLKAEMWELEETCQVIVEAKDAEINRLKNLLDKQAAKTNQALEQLACFANVPRLDKVVTYTSAKDYMIRMRKYERVNQIMDMMSELTRGNTTAEEEQEIRDLKDYLLSDEPREIHYHNENKNSVVMQGIMNVKDFPMGGDPQEFLNWAIPAYNAYLRNGKQG